MVKTRLQVSGDGTNGARNYKALGIGGTVNVIFKEEGVSAFWKGIGAAWLREASYTSLRLGNPSHASLCCLIINLLRVIRSHQTRDGRNQ